MRAAYPDLPLEVEVDTVEQAREVIDAGADLVLLDNMAPAEHARRRRGSRAGRARLEASGGLRLENARAVAETGVDYLAVGALTHSAPVLDIGLDISSPHTRTDEAMLLAIDIGNTNTVLGVFDGEKLERSWRIKTDARSTADELALTFRGLLADHEITGVAACSTVPAALRELRAMLDELLPEHADRARRAGHPHRRQPAVREPEGGRRRPHRQHRSPRTTSSTAGRRSSSTSARRRTSTCVNERGDFLGGALAPGIEISLDALAARAAQLRKVELVAPRGPIGKSTVEALQSGILYGFAGQVDGLVRRLSAALAPGRPGRGRGDRHRRPGAAASSSTARRSPATSPTDPARAAPDLRAQHLITVEQDGPPHLHRAPAGRDLRRPAARSPGPPRSSASTRSSAPTTTCRWAATATGLPGPTDAWVTLAALARETSAASGSARSSTPATFRLPGPLAISVAQVDQMSGGRVELGLGAGWFERRARGVRHPVPDGRASGSTGSPSSSRSSTAC